MSPCQTSRFGLRQVRLTFWISASNQSSWLAKSGSARQPAGSYPAADGRKSTTSSSPLLARSRSWISGSGSAAAIRGSRQASTSSGARSPSRRASSPPTISATSAWYLSRAPEFEHVGTQVVRLDQRGQPAALAQRGHIADHRYLFQHAGQGNPRPGRGLGPRPASSPAIMP